jgi:DNA-binding MarR family transcriptional regulator
MHAGDLNQELMQLARTLHVLRQHVATHSPGGVPWSTYTLLFHLVTGGPRRAGALAGCVQVDASTVSRQVDQLVQLGLVERRADPDDGRATQLVATDTGHALYARVREARERMLADLLGAWTQEDLDTLTGLLARLNHDLTDGLPQLMTVMTADSTAATSHLTGDPR